MVTDLRPRTAAMTTATCSPAVGRSDQRRRRGQRPGRSAAAVDPFADDCRPTCARHVPRWRRCPGQAYGRSPDHRGRQLSAQVWADMLASVAVTLQRWPIIGRLAGARGVRASAGLGRARRLGDLTGWGREDPAGRRVPTTGGGCRSPDRTGGGQPDHRTGPAGRGGRAPGRRAGPPWPRRAGRHGGAVRADPPGAAQAPQGPPPA